MLKHLFIIILFIGSLVSAQEINWLSIEEGEKAQQQNPDKALFITVYTDWCGFCKKMDNSTFKDEELVSFVNEYFIPVKLDAEQKESITFRNQTFEYRQVGRRGVHELAAALLQGQMSYPSVVVMNNEQITHIFKGFMSANDLMNGL